LQAYSYIEIMKATLLASMDRSRIEELLYHALRTIYLFERSEIEHFGLDYQQMYLLKYLKRATPLRVSETAEVLQIPVFSATRLINQLEKKKLISRNRDVKDRRNIFIRLSATGEDIIRKVEDHSIEMIMKRMSGYNDEQISVMIDLIRNIDVILGVENDLRKAALSQERK
jgi:DNA-binding MarR family transcriptional regulator